MFLIPLICRDILKPISRTMSLSRLELISFLLLFFYIFWCVCIGLDEGAELTFVRAIESITLYLHLSSMKEREE